MHRPQDAETRGISGFAGILSGSVAAWARRLDTTPEDVVQALSAVPVLLDTAEAKGHENQDRPTAPHLRCIGLVARHVPALRAEIDRLRSVGTATAEGRVHRTQPAPSTLDTTAQAAR